MSTTRVTLKAYVFRKAESNRMNNTHQAITNPKKATLGNTDFKINSIIRVRRGH